MSALRRVLAIALVLGSADLATAKEAEEPARVEIGGRLFFRVEAEEQNDEATLTPSVASARIETTYKWRKWLRVVLEAELEGKLRDAYVEVKKRRVEVRAGQFKPPVSAIEMASAWTLPTVTRGLLHEVLTAKLQIGGRRPGAQVEWTGRGQWRPRASIGAFQPSVYKSEPFEGAGPDDVVVAGRASLRRGPVEIGVSGESMQASAGLLVDRERVWAAGADVTLDHVWCDQGIRAWAEVLVGSSPFTFGDGLTTFGAARGIAAWRRGVTEGARYVEPYAMVGWLDPDLAFNDDTVVEAAAGVNVGAWRRLRVTLEVALQRVEKPPAGLEPDLTTLDPFLVDREVLRLQVGARW